MDGSWSRTLGVDEFLDAEGPAAPLAWLVTHGALVLGYALAVIAISYMLRQRRSAPETIAFWARGS